VWRGREEVYETATEERELDAAGAVAWMRSLFGDDPGRVYWDVVRMLLEQGRGVSREDRYEDGSLVAVEVDRASPAVRRRAATDAERTRGEEGRGEAPGGHGATAADYGPDPGGGGLGPRPDTRGHGEDPDTRYGTEPGAREQGERGFGSRG